MSLADNLAALKTQRGRAKSRRKEVLSTLMSIAEERQAKEAANTSPVAGTSSKALENLTSDGAKAATGGHSPGDGHAHGPLSGGKGGFDPNFNGALSKLLKDFGGKVKVNSGYRSPERQSQLWAGALKKYGNAAAARKWVAPPGKSNHGRGLAADLGYADAATRKLIHQRAGQYGLHFPLGNENWHIEPVSARKR